MARLAQSVERQPFKLVVVGSSPTVGVLFFWCFTRPLLKKLSEQPESNQRPFDICSLYSQTLYQLSYVRFLRHLLYLHSRSQTENENTRAQPTTGIEPATLSLRSSRSTTKLYRLLCQLASTALCRSYFYKDVFLILVLLIAVAIIA